MFKIQYIVFISFSFTGGGGFMSSLTQGTKNFGGQFLNKAKGTGLLGDAQTLLDDSKVGKAVKNVVEKTQLGIDKLNNVKEEAEKFAREKKYEVQKLCKTAVNKGDGIIVQAKEKVKEYVAEAQKIDEQLSCKNLLK
jgi:hypothetical protein